MECIEAIRSALGGEGFIAYCQGNVTKYLWRHRRKGGIEDLERAKWYIDRMIEEERELVMPLEMAEELFKKGGIFAMGRSNHKEVSMEEMARANPALGHFVYGQRPEDEK